MTVLVRLLCGGLVVGAWSSCGPVARDSRPAVSRRTPKDARTSAPPSARPVARAQFGAGATTWAVWTRAVELAACLRSASPVWLTVVQITANVDSTIALRSDGTIWTRGTPDRRQSHPDRKSPSLHADLACGSRCLQDYRGPSRRLLGQQPTRFARRRQRQRHRAAHARRTPMARVRIHAQPKCHSRLATPLSSSHSNVTGFSLKQPPPKHGG